MYKLNNKSLFTTVKHKIHHVEIDDTVIMFDMDLDYLDHVDCFPQVIDRDYKVRRCEFDYNDRFDIDGNGYHFQLARIYARYGVNCAKELLSDTEKTEQTKSFISRLSSAGLKLRKEELVLIYDATFKR